MLVMSPWDATMNIEGFFTIVHSSIPSRNGTPIGKCHSAIAIDCSFQSSCQCRTGICATLHAAGCSFDIMQSQNSKHAATAVRHAAGGRHSLMACRR